MKPYLLFLLPLLFSSFTINETSCRQKKFRVEVKEESMLWNNNYVITNESITINRVNRVTTLTTVTVIKLSKDQSGEIAALLEKIDWKTLKDSYVDATAPQDMFTYNFTFTLDQMTRKVHIYQEKQEEIFNLVQKINQMIVGFPAEYQIGYNEGYFRNKR